MKRLRHWLKGEFVCTKCGRTYHVMTFGFGTARCPLCYDGGEFLDFDESFVLNRLLLRILRRPEKTKAFDFLLREEMSVYPKTWGSRQYEILDNRAYQRYWCGKRPTSKIIFEEWLSDPGASMYEVSAKHGKYSCVIQRHVTVLNKIGVLRRGKGVENR